MTTACAAEETAHPTAPRELAHTGPYQGMTSSNQSGIAAPGSRDSRRRGVAIAPKLTRT